MKNLHVELKSLSGVNCYLYKDKQYQLSNQSLNRYLPLVSARYEQVLINNGISYNRKTGSCELYDPDCYEFETLSLPVYIVDHSRDCYRYTGKNYSKSIPTHDTVTAAIKVLKHVQQLIKVYDFEQTINQVLEESLSLLKNRDICYVRKLNSYSSINNLEDRIEKDLLYKHNIYISRRYSDGGNGSFAGFVILDVEKASEKTVLDIVVGEDIYPGIIIGYGGKNLKLLLRDINKDCKINIKKINVYQQ